MPASKAPLPDSLAKGENPMPSSFDDDLEFWDEGRLQKFFRRLKEDPLIPVGLGLTTWALLGATRSIRRGNKTQTNMYFRFRVYAQAFTLLCICVGGMYWKGDREKRKHYQELLDEKRAQAKRDAWIRELEARDEEDKAEREEKARRIAAIRKDKAAAAAAANPEKKADASSALDDEELMNLVGSTRFLGKAIMLFRMRNRE